MADLLRLLTPEELKALDPKDREILKLTLEHALRTDEGIRQILERRVREVLARIRQTPSPETSSAP
jgi:hypothetical protein